MGGCEGVGCVYVFMYICICISMCEHLHTCMYIWVCFLVCTHEYVYCVYVCMYYK